MRINICQDLNRFTWTHTAHQKYGVHRALYIYVGLGTIFLLYLDPSHPTRGLKQQQLCTTAKIVIFKFNFETNTSCALHRVHVRCVGLSLTCRFHEAEV